jgi:hypothetical protein
MFTTPAGTSLVASASPSATASGAFVMGAITMAAFPAAITGRISDSIASSGCSSGTTTATVPVASGIENTKYGPATGCFPPSTDAILSVQPAKHTQRSTAWSTSRAAAAFERPSMVQMSEMNSARRASSISAMR